MLIGVRLKPADIPCGFCRRSLDLAKVWSAAGPGMPAVVFCSADCLRCYLIPTANQ